MKIRHLGAPFVAALTLLIVGMSSVPAYAERDLLAGRWSINDGESIVEIADHGGSYTGTIVAKSPDSDFCWDVGMQILEVTGSGQHFSGSEALWDTTSGCGARFPDGTITIDVNSDGTLATIAIAEPDGSPCTACRSEVWTRDGPAPGPDRTPLWIGLGIGAVILGGAATLLVRLNRPNTPGGPGGPGVSFQPRLDGAPTLSVQTPPDAPAVSVRLVPRVSGGPVTIKEVPR